MYRVEKDVRMEAIRMSFARATRIVLTAVIVAAIGASPGAASAGAATGCGAELQTALDSAGSGATVVLDGMCTGSYTLRAGATFTLEGAPGTTSGFDGTGATSPLLGNLASTEAGAMTLSHLTFEHANLHEASALSLRASRVTLSDDSFLENVEHGENAHAAFVQIPSSSCPSAGAPPVITLTGSTFSRNTLVLGAGRGGGAGAWLEDACNAGSVLEKNVFEDDVLEAAGTHAEVVVSGAGLQFVGPSHTRPEPVVSQRGNVFDSDNVIASAPAEADYGGGGEWLEYASLRSVDDRFSRDSVPGTALPVSSPEYAWSWGGGLGIWTPEQECQAPTYPHPESTLEDAIVEGDSIGPGTPRDIGGGGVYVGCSHLNVFDSTFILNTAYSGAAIEGESGDELELANSILAEGTGAEEIAGFESGGGGSQTTSFSDVCNPAGSSEPLPGAGNICADPLLADDDEPLSFDVHETSSSPTIDAGSNALVPSELTTDAYGTTRILAGRTGCAGSFPAVVDMGAAEFVPSAPPPCTAPTQEQTPAQQVPTPALTTQQQTPASELTSQPQTPAGPQAHFVSLELSSTGIGLRLSCASNDGRGCAGTIYITSEETLKGKKVVAVDTSNPDKSSVRLGQASFSLATGATATFHVKLNSTGLALLRHFHAFSAWVLANEAMPSDSQVVFLLHAARFSEPKQAPKSSKRKPKKG
jgi:hypothetical protein